MTRNMIAANASIFETLDDYCMRRGERLQNAGNPRWIASGHADRNFLQRAAVGEKVYFSPTRKLSIFSFEHNNYYVATGFEAPINLAGLSEIDVSGGLLTLALAELEVRPKATPAEIRQHIEVSDRISDPQYQGHGIIQIANLFPIVKYFRDEISSSIWNTFFRITLMECRYQGGWMDEDLLDLLEEVAGLDEDRIPYKVLCRSIFDYDPSSFYLALYRCLEALFSYYSSLTLSAKLNLTHNWLEVANALESTLGWRPQELLGLEGILRFSVNGDLRNILMQFGVVDIPLNEDELIKKAAKEIYKVRNSVVHYRAGTRDFDFGNTNWNGICKYLSMIVLHVYGEMIV